MKPRHFPARIDLDAGANIRRLHAYIKSMNPAYTVAGRMERQIQMKKTAKLNRVK